jgi:TolA-binding protein
MAMEDYMKKSVVALLVALCVALPAVASADKVVQILLQQREIRSQSESSTGAYSRFDREELDRMHAAQDRIFSLLDGVSSLDQLSASEQVEVFNSIEVVKAVISGNEADRQKCWREHKLGSTIPKTRCATIAEIQQISEGAQQWKGEASICGNMGDGVDCGGNARDSIGSR